MSSTIPNDMYPCCANGEVQNPQWSVDSQVMLPTHPQQPPTSILTSSSSNGSSNNTIQVPLKQLSLNDQYATGYPQLIPHLNNYNAPVQNGAVTALNCNERNWEPVIANNIAPQSSIHRRSNIQYSKPNQPLKPKRIRTAFNDVQLTGLEQHFAIEPYIDRDKRKELAEKLRLTSRNVKIWFQNKRQKKKKAGEAVSQISGPTTEKNSQYPQNGLVQYQSPSIMTPQEYQMANAVDVTPHVYSYAASSNHWNVAQPSTSKDNIQPINGLSFSSSIYYTDQQQNTPMYQNLEGPSTRSELIAASTCNELQMQDAYSGQQATWIPDYSSSDTMEVQPHM